MAYLDWLMTEFDRDPLMVIAAYNAGEGAVRANAGVPPYAETRDYVPKVLAAWQVAQGLCLTPPELVTDTRPLAEALADKRISAVLVGPGLGRAASTVASVRRVVEGAARPLVVDGDALVGVLSERDVVQRVVARHGGRIWAEARPGEGAAFFVALRSAAPHA
mgnify:CR=1 FL=1